MDKTTYFPPNRVLRLGNHLLDLSVPRIMGILNVTPDSFYDGGEFVSPETALRHVEKMIRHGADIIDIGGMSSRPGAPVITTEEELKRVLPVLTAIVKEFPDSAVSIDTVHSGVAIAAIEHGAAMINDISAGKIDPQLISVAAKYKVPYVLMHMQGTPSTMQKEPHYENVCEEVLQFFIDESRNLIKNGVQEIIIDPGFGFGKTLQHNYELAAHLDQFSVVGFPILAGVSRKSMICQLLKVNPDKALNGSTALHAILLMKGVNILRVHDVREAKETIEVFMAVNSENS